MNHYNVYDYRGVFLGTVIVAKHQRPWDKAFDVFGLRVSEVKLQGRVSI